jgi:hypothetical protein
LIWPYAVEATSVTPEEGSTMTNCTRRGAVLTAVLVMFCGSSAAAQSCPDPTSLTRGLTEPLATVRYLADDALEGRRAGSPGERCAGDYIAARFRELGLRPAGSAGSYFQDVPLASLVNPHAPGGTGRNVLGVLEGTDPALRDEVIIIGAHYDHLGHGGAGSMAPGEAAIHNGADDNASGVAALLKVAAELAPAPPSRSVVFIAFTGEESGLLGSAHFTRDPTIPLNRALAMLNMDMVGRLESDPLIVYGTGTADEWTDLLSRHAAELGIELASRPEGYGPSDHTSFYIQDMPVLHFFTNTHADYHRPSDDWDRIDAAGLERIAALVARVARGLASEDSRLTLRRGVGQPQPGAASARSGAAWLGTVPDFTPVERGVLLGGVTAGSPGEAAGMQKGDTLIRLGVYEIADLEGFTGALRAHQPGDEVEIVVLRDGRELKLRAVLGTRGS